MFYYDTTAGTITLTGTATLAAYLTREEDGTSHVTLEDGSGALLLESSLGSSESLVTNDSRSGTVTLSGTASSSFVHSGVFDFRDNSAIPVTLGGIKAQTHTHSRSGLGAIVYSAKAVGYSATYADPAYEDFTPETQTHTSSRSGSITFTGSKVEDWALSDAMSGQITLNGTRIENSLQSKAATGSLQLSGTGTDQYTQGGNVTYNDTVIGTLTLSGVHTETRSHTSTGMGALVLSGLGSAPAETSIRFGRAHPSRQTGYPFESPERIGAFRKPRPGKVTVG